MFHDVKQNTDEWLDLRMGKLTGSAIGKVMANYGKAFGDPAKKYAVTLACEQLTGRRGFESYSNAHMERGHEQEPLARARYEDEHFIEVTNGGFFDCGNKGCSPDGLVSDDGLVEIKSVIATVHYANIKRGTVDPAYKWQHYFNLYHTKRDWIDFVSYCADFPEQTQLYTYRIYADDCAEQFEQMNERINEFFELVETVKETIRG